MKIVVAVDSFKGLMRSDEAGSIIARALERELPNDEIVVIPIADGGEGTADAVVLAAGGELRSTTVSGPCGSPVVAPYGVLPDGETAVIEIAAASGIELVPPDARDPLTTTTFGAGELLRTVIEAGARVILIGIGGSATVDGGVGMAQALGYRLYAADGGEVGRGGGELERVERIDDREVLPELAACRIRVACDVANPLLGERGAARVFGPQKGAGPAVVERLEAGLANLAEVWRRHGMLDAVDQPGDGAAGGLGAGLRAFCSAELCSGAELIAEITGFDREIGSADLLVTGEGRTDRQTEDGKLCSVLAAKARVAGVRTVLISGAVVIDEIDAIDEHFDAVFSTVQDVGTIEDALAAGHASLERTARSVGAVLAMGRRAGAEDRGGGRGGAG